MKVIKQLTISICFFTILFSTQKFTLTDGSVIQGKVISESESEMVIETQFGEMTVLKSDILAKMYKVELKSGDSIIGEKVYEDELLIKLKTNYGEVELKKSEISSITEKGAATNNNERYTHVPRQYGLAGLLSGGDRFSKDTDFSLGEEQLIDLFFDPTAYTLKQGTLYLSGFSFGFGLTDKIQLSTKWVNFLWGDMNLRPKIKLFESGNWEKQHALSIGAHYHSKWPPNSKYEWKSGSAKIIEFTGNESWGSENCPDNSNDCWQQTAPADTVTKYWGGYFHIGDSEEQTEVSYHLPNGYSPTDTGVYYDYEPYAYSNDIGDNDDFFVPMIELFGAYTFSKAREGLKGRISHTFGGDIQYFEFNEKDYLLYRAYYGLDVDVNSKLKMIGEIFYDPNYLEIWQTMDNIDVGDYNDYSTTPIEKPSTMNDIHTDIGFIYALNESFRFGIHFQQPWIAFYWKF